MKKSLVALAAVVATGAFAQSSVTLYGVADAYVGSQKVAGLSQTVINSGGLSGSRVGVSVKEDLGAGLAAFAVLEAGANIDTGTGVFARKSVLGLSGSFGSVSLGRQDSPHFDAFDGVIDAQATDAFSAATSVRTVAVANTKLNNSVRYDTPNFDGFSAGVQLGLGENKTATTRAGRDTSFAVQYANGPLGVALGHTIDENSIGATNKISMTDLGGYYDFGMAKLNLGLNNTKVKNVAGKDKGWNLGVTAPIGAFTVIGQLASNKFSNAKKRTAIGLEGRYALSKRTTSYVGFNQTKDNNRTVNKTDRLLGVGVRHVF